MSFHRKRYYSTSAGGAGSKNAGQGKWKRRAEIKKQLRILELISSAGKDKAKGDGDDDTV